MLINLVPEVSVMPEAWTLYQLLDLNSKKEESQALKYNPVRGAMKRN